MVFKVYDGEKSNIRQPNENKERYLIVCYALHAKEEPNSWVIDSEYSNHMSSDRKKFINLEENNCGSIKFDGVESPQVCDKGTISIHGNIKIEDVLYVKGLRHNLLSVGQMCSKGNRLTFDDKFCEIRKGNSRRVVAKGT